jgi:hypothetical protein
MVKPNFVIAGASKSGTTALYHGLKQHPDIYLPMTKELHYFSYPELSRRISGPGDKVIVHTIVSSWDAYLSQYRTAGSGHLARGDVSPSYLFFPAVAERIRSKLGPIRVIIILRNPADKIFSQYSHLVRDGRETLSFAQALEEEPYRRRRGWSDMWLYRESGFYCDRVSEYMRVFGKESVLVVFFEAFRSDPVHTLQTIARFLGVSPDYRFQPPSPVNVSGMPRSKLLSRVVIAGPLFVLAKKYFPVSLGGKIKRLIMRINTGEKLQIGDQLREMLLSEYRQDIQCLGRLVDRDIIWR